MEPANSSGNLLLYPGEVLDTIAGLPTIYHYQPASNPGPAQQPKPLIVCVPGGMHLGRVFYGGHEGSKPSDFLAYWLNKQGFGVLSLSYPLESTPEIMAPTATNCRIPDWGRQAALTTKMVCDKASLGNRSIILISWSMGGRIVVPFSASAKELGLTVQQYISFAATPGFSSIRPLPPGIACTSTGHFIVPPVLDIFWQQLKEMIELNDGKEFISRDIWLREYVGATPINLVGIGLKYDGKGAFVQDEIPHEEDSHVLDIPNLPFITGLVPTSNLDASHALGDRAAWGFLLTYRLETMIGKLGIANVAGSPKWQRLLELVHSAPGRLCVPVPGNHFFFLGEKNARIVSEKVSMLVDNALEFQAELSDLISQ